MRIKNFILFICLPFAAFATNYFVDSEAAAGGDGSSGAPLQKISDGIKKLTAGDTLFVYGGNARQYNESFSISDSYANGSETVPIVVRSINDEKVNVQLSSSLSIYRDWWQFDGFSFDAQQGTFDAIKPRGDHLSFRNCTVFNGQRDGFDANLANYLLIENCTIYNFNRSDQYDAHGIIINGGTDTTIRGNTIYDCKGDCIQLYKSDQNYQTLIEGNDLYTTLGPGSENAIDIKATKGCTIRYNKMHGFHNALDSDGVALKINKDSDNVLVEGNDIYESNGGIRVSGGEMDTLRIIRNVIHDLHVDDGDTSKYGYGVQFDGVNQVTLLNNTFANIPGPLFWLASGGATDMDMRNNLFFNSNVFKGSVNEFNGTVLIDYNGWFDCREIISGTHDVQGNDPGFADAPLRDYRLSSASPAIDAGDPAMGTDFPGQRIDLGAFEYTESTGLHSDQPKTPWQFELKPNYPNPFNPETNIPVYSSKPVQATLSLFNIAGQEIRRITRRISGSHEFHISADNLASGTYLFRLQSGTQIRYGKMLLVR